MAKQLELLAPAGSPQILKAVICAGADAVYVGGSRFSARAYAKNFSQKDLLWAIDYAHLNGRKLYLAVNTLLKENELLEELYDYLLPCYKQGLDAVIVQDFGVMQFIRKNFGDLPIHASTQMTVVSEYGARFLAKAGASRIVMARELSLREISEIKKAVPVELEAFVHGAICYSYSGQCLFSSMLGGRSGNRGRCAQPCRLPYEVFCGRERLLGKNKAYPLSPKDLCAIELLPQLAESGVFSFKIEGRMKQAEYAAGVVSVYRAYLDRYLEYGSKDYALSPKDRKKLLDFGSRSGFTQGCLIEHSGADMMAFDKPCHEKGKDGGTETADTQKEPKIKISGHMEVKSGRQAELLVWVFGGEADQKAGVTGEVAVPAERRAVTEESLRMNLCKTGNTPFAFESLELLVEEGLFLPVSSVNEMRRQALEALKEQCLMPYRRKEPQQKEAPAVCKVKQPGEKDGREEPLCFTASAATKDQLSVLLDAPFLSCIYIDSAMLKRSEAVSLMQEIRKAAKDRGKQAYYILPAVFCGQTAVWYESVLSRLSADGYLVKGYDALEFLLSHGVSPKRIRLDYNLSAWSEKGRRAFAFYGMKEDTVPVELNRKEIMERRNDGSEALIYGALPLMVSAHCLVRNTKGCSHAPCTLTLKDRYGISFPVKNNCAECYNVIYNSRPLNLFSVMPELKSAGIMRYRLSFTTETKEQTKRILDIFAQGQGLSRLKGGVTGIEEGVPKEFTYGHYKRGVE